jgi:peptidoglycan biosynthesis protein MviN/MurJ (putative lipid II flippase)
MMYFFGSTVFGLISKFSKADILAYHNYFWAGSFFFIFHVLTNYLNTILTSLKYFSVPMIISSIKSSIAIACIFLLKADYDVLAVFLAGLIAYAVNLVVLLVVMRKVAGWKFSVQTYRVKKTVWGNIFYAQLGQLTTVASSMFPLYLLSGFGSGIISDMNYGKNIADIPNTLVTSQFSNVSGIKLNEQVAQNDHAGMNDTFVRTSRLLVFILVPLGFYLFVFATPMVELFYRGKNFSADDAAGAAVFLKLLAVTIFSIGINTMVTRLFIALQAIRQAFVYQFVLNILLIISIWLCTQRYGAYGYPYGIIIMHIINCLGMYFICKKLLAVINYRSVLMYTGLIVLINAAICTCLYFGMQWVNAANLPLLVSGFLVYLIILLILNKKFRLNTDLSHIIEHVKQKFH